MNSGATNSCFPNAPRGLQMYDTLTQDMVVPPPPLDQPTNPTWENHSNSLLYTLSLLKEKVHQVESLVTIFISPNQTQQAAAKSTAMALASMGTLVQEIMVTSSSLMFSCQQMALCSTPANNTTSTTTEQLHRSSGGGTGTSSHPINCDVGREERGHGFYPPAGDSTLDWFTCDTNDQNPGQGNIIVCDKSEGGRRERDRERERNLPQNNEGSPKNYDIIELDAADLLAKYTHYCQVCGKGFKRDANLRMHMRAHGDEYKSSAALANPMKNNHNTELNSSEHKDSTMKRKYSCPHEGCRWNKKHAKFQPLKSMICVKNHYKRSHCPKMYVCKRCNRKQFSVLSDLRTHEKHCGDLKWQCSCGTTFSRKDKLMGHVALFVGHTPVIGGCSTNKVVGKVEQRHDHQVGMRVDIV